MSRSPILEQLEQDYNKKDIPAFKIGDTVRVSTRIVEGDKERIQAFSGTVVAKKGTGLSETFTLYRNAYGSNMDRVFLLHSPRISSIQVMRSGKVRRAKLYYLRGKAGKSAKIKEQYTGAPKEVLSQEKAPEASSES